MGSLRRTERRNVIIVNIMIAAVLLLFFATICPLVPYDADGWIYIGNLRIPWPHRNTMSPARVLPESLMPLCGYISGYLVYPFLGDYLSSIALTSAVIISGFILVMCICFLWFVHRRFKVSINMSLLYEVLFLIFFWAIFRNRGNSRYMFYADNMCCVFFYTISGIVNAIAVLWMMSYEDFQEAFTKFSSLKKSLFVTLIYFTAFSNIYHSETLAIYCGVILLNGILKMVKEKAFSLKEYAKKYWLYLSILLLWFVAAFLEMTGDRAGMVSSGSAFSIETPLRQLYAMLQAIADPFMVVFVLALVWILYCSLRKKGKEGNMYFSVLVNTAILTIYLILLGAIIPYVSRIEASWNLWFYVILITMMGIISFVARFEHLKVFLIPALFISFVATIYPDGRFLMSNLDHSDYETCVNVGNYMIDQIVEADNRGETYVEVHAPIYTDEKLEWAYEGNFAQNVANALYNHGIIRNKIEVNTISDPNLFEELRKIE